MANVEQSSRGVGGQQTGGHWQESAQSLLDQTTVSEQLLGNARADHVVGAHPQQLGTTRCTGQEAVMCIHTCAWQDHRRGSIPEDDEKPKGPRTARICLYIVVISIIVNLLMFVPTYAVLKSSTNKVQVEGIVQTDGKTPTAEAHQSARENENTIHPLVVGRFKIDQERLDKKKELRWTVADDTPRSAINASTTDPCVIVPSAGLYSVFSQITFSFDFDTHFNRAGHSIHKIRHSDNRSEFVQMKAVHAPRNRTEIVHEASNLISFPLAEAGDKICVNASPVEVVYISPIDNMLTLFKL